MISYSSSESKLLIVALMSKQYSIYKNQESTKIVVTASPIWGMDSATTHRRLSKVSILKAAGIAFYNFHWEDMTNPTMKQLLVNVTLMDKYIWEGHKVLVHCHAGKGWTALVIAAYLFYDHTCEEEREVIRFIQAGRWKCLWSKENQKHLTYMIDELARLRKVFPLPWDELRLSLKESLSN